MKTTAYSDEVLLNMLKTNERDQALTYIYTQKEWRSNVANLIRNNGSDLSIFEDHYSDTLIIFERNIRLNRYEGKSSLKTYFVSISKYLLITKTRQLQRIELKAEPTDKAIPNYLTPEMQFILSEEKNLIYEILDGMGEPYKSVLLLWGLSYSMKEIAKVIGLENAGKAKRLAYRCRQKLREVIRKNPNLLKKLR